MPIYEYQCSACDHCTEKMQNINAAQLTHCDNCGKETMQKVISAPSVQFKGEGWYVTDYKKQPKDKPAADKQPAKDAPADAACTKPDCGTKEGGSK